MSAITEEIIDAQTGEIMLRPTTAPTATLFGTDDPLAVVEKMSRVADALTDIITKRQLFSTINDKKFVNVEGWTTVGALVGIFPVLRWTRPIEVDGKLGWEARVEAVTLSGAVVGAAESMCLKGESGTWRKDSNDNAVRSMAQTRATSKALRQPLDFLVKMAGYVATPAEEMENSEPAAGGQRGAQPTAAASPHAGAAPKEASVTPASAAAADPVPVTELYKEALELATTLWLRENPADSKADAEAGALARLDKAVQDKWGVALDKLNHTNLEKVVLSYRVKVSAEI